MIVPTASYTLVKKGVNNKSLFNKIHEFIAQGIVESDIVWSDDDHRETFVMVADDGLTDFYEQGLIDQWNVICDMRNNTISNMDQGIYTVEITYRQKNCINTTSLIYTIKDLMAGHVTDQLDLDLYP